MFTSSSAPSSAAVRASSSARSRPPDRPDHRAAEPLQPLLDLQGDEHLVLDHQDAQVGQGGHDA
jgi:hypothetical protein